MARWSPIWSGITSRRSTCASSERSRDAQSCRRARRSRGNAKLCLAESVVGATLAAIPGFDVHHPPARDRQPEVDFILTVGIRRIPLEVKYRRGIDQDRDPAGWLAFLDRNIHNAPFGLLITQADIEPLDDPRLVALPLSSFLLLR